VTTYVRDAVRNDLGALFDHGVLANLTDGQLLERFAGRSGELSEIAFGTLLERHGPMVLRVCRNVLKDPHDVEDAFQATFVVLIRKAGSIRKRGSCGSWLHGVALRAAAGIRTATARRRDHERKSALNVADGRISERTAPPDELPVLIDQELARLRDDYRSPLVLCYLEGHSCEEAARQLGWPVGTVKSRLSRGRERLRRQLIGRGIAPGLVFAAGTTPTSPVRAAVPAALEARVLEQSVQLAGRGACVAALPSTLAALVRAELTRGRWTHVVQAGVALLVIGMALAAAVPQRSTTADDPPAAVVQVKRPKAKSSPIHAKVVDLQGKAVEGAEVAVFQETEPVFKGKTDHDGLVMLAKPRADHGFTLLARSRDGVAGLTHYGPIPLEGGTADKPLVLTLAPSTHKLTGSVVDPQGQPIAGVRVIGRGLHFDDSNFFVSRQNLEDEGYPLGSSITDAKGRYSLTLSARGDVTLAFLHPQRVSPWIVVPEDAEVVEPITLQPAGRITGRVIDATTGKAVAGAELGAQFLESPSETNGAGGVAVSDPQGRFAIDGLEAGVYNVCLSKVPGRAQATARAAVAVRVRSNEDTPIDLKVIDGIPLRGLVIDPATNKPLPDVAVWCQGPANPRPGNSFDMHLSDDRGEFTFFVPPGENFTHLPFAGDGMRNSRLSRAIIFVPENGTVPPVRLVGPVLDRPAAMQGMILGRTTVKSVRSRRSFQRPKRPEGRTVTGQVLDADGRPLVGVTIAARVITERSTNTVTTVVSDSQGIFIAKGLPGGEVTMVAMRLGGVRSGDPLTQIVPGDRSTVEFSFGPALPADAQFPGQPAPATDEPIPPAVKDRLTFVNLDPNANKFLADGPGSQGDDLNRLTQGIHALDGVYYRIGEKMIHIRAKAAPGLPDMVSGIAVSARADRIQILHTARGEAPLGAEVAVYTVRYTDGSSERIPAVYGRDLGDWFSSTRHALITPTHARVAWIGANDMADRMPGNQIKIHLFGVSWKNTHPDRVIATIDVASTSTKSELVLVGITLERDLPR
jgi:RNA polymerase sigma factor (sigma-70 family)